MICESCADTGLVRVNGAEDYGISFESEYCDRCRYGRALIAEEITMDELSEAYREVQNHHEHLGERSVSDDAS
jgi:hypothetical protein